MFIQTEATSDPMRMKFLPGRRVLPTGTLDIPDQLAAAQSPLASKLFTVEGVAAVSFGADYITVTRDGGDWRHLKPQLLGLMMEHFLAEAPIVNSPARSAGDAPDDDPVIADVKAALRQVIDPELGYNIVDLGLIYDVSTAEAGGIDIVMTTTTRGCPATNYLVEGARTAAAGIPGVTAVEVELTYDPPWTTQQMSADAKAHFGIRD
jgi:metal-sulfur cluster biosynthetic enzyme